MQLLRWKFSRPHKECVYSLSIALSRFTYQTVHNLTVHNLCALVKRGRGNLTKAYVPHILEFLYEQKFTIVKIMPTLVLKTAPVHVGKIRNDASWKLLWLNTVSSTIWPTYIYSSNLIAPRTEFDRSNISWIRVYWINSRGWYVDLAYVNGKRIALSLS